MNLIFDLFEKRAQENKDLTPKMKDILRASLDLFSEKGYSNTSTKDIAQTANVAEGTIFKHFGTKENLLYSTLIPLLKHTLVEELQKELTIVASSIEEYSFEEFLKVVLKARIAYAEDTLKVFKILYMEYLYQENLRVNLLSLIPKGIVKEINSVLNYYKDKKEIVDLPNKELFRLLGGTLISFVLTNEMIPTTEEVKLKEIENMIMFLTKGLRPN